MKSKIRMIASAMVACSMFAALQGCVTGLDETQLQKMDVYEKKGLLVKEKSPVAAGFLGVLPVTGYAYTGHPFLSVTTIPLYPFFGPIWMSMDAVKAARSRNYYATELQVQRDESRDKKVNDKALLDKKITYEQHMTAERAIEDKYAAF
jgi:hypothetical protein